METLLAEDLLLLLLDDESGRLRCSRNDIGTVLAGALLSELALTELVKVTERPGKLRSALALGWSTAQVTPVDGAVTDDALLARAMAPILESPRTTAQLIIPMGRWAKDALLERLHHRRLVQPVDDKVLGLFPRTSWPVADRTREAEVRERIQATLVTNETPDNRTAALISLLSAVNQAQHCIGRGDLTDAEVQQRAADIRARDWMAQTVRSLLEMGDELGERRLGP